MILPPLPIVDGKLFVDNSTLEPITTCPTAATNLWLHGRESVGGRPPLTFGRIIHSSLAFRYLNDKDLCDPKTSEGMVDVLTNEFSQVTMPTTEWRTLDLATKLVRAYNLAYPYEEFHIASTRGNQPFVEQSFALKLGTITYPAGETIDVIYCGRIDLLVLLDGKDLFVMDHKTTSMLGDSFWADQAVSPQYIGYCWAVRESFQQTPIGYLVNTIRTRQPIKRDELNQPISPKTKRRSDVEEDDFQRQKFYINDKTIEEWRGNTLDIIANFVQQHAAGRMPMHRKWCVHKYGRCQYYDVCSLPSEQRAIMLSSEMFVDRTWSPLSPH